MTRLAHYYIPGVDVEDHRIEVPLDWRGNVPGRGFSGESIGLFYRVLTAPDRINDDLPLLVFLQGGPGGSCPRPTSPSSDGWIAEAIRHFRVVLPDQRGTGRSSRIDSHVMARLGSADRQAEYLKRFLADSIVRDVEHLRLTGFGRRRWVSLGQSYGGFLTLTYLSLFPEGLAACFTTGGIPHVPSDAEDLYRHTFPKMVSKTRQYYARYPQDVDRVAAVADHVASEDVRMPNGDRLTVERLQTLGSDFGMKPSFERLHWLMDEAFVDGAGEATARGDLSDEFLDGVMRATSSRPLYWPLQEFIYADGELDRPLRWAADRVRRSMPVFSPDGRPLMFTGEAVFPWMFEQESALRPFAAAVGMLMEDTRFGRLYDPERLRGNEIPLQSAVYVDDMYVPSDLQLDTLSRVGNSHYWATNEFEHDGVHGDAVFRRLYQEALDRGDLAGVL